MNGPLVVLDGLLLAGRHTGVENAILNLARAFLRDTEGCQVRLVAPGRTHAGSPPGEGPLHRALAACDGLQEAEGDFSFCEVPGTGQSRLSRILWEQFNLPGFARRHGADVLHCPGYVMPIRYRGPSVLTVYDVLALQHPEWCSRLNALHYKALMPPSIRRASAVIVPAEAVRKDLLRIVPRAEAVHVVPLGIGPEFRRVTIPAALNEVRQRHKLPERFVLTVGNIEPKKNVEGMVAAYDRIAGDCPADLVIAGGLGWRYEAALAAIAAAKCQARIHRIGYVPQEDLPALYSLADVMLQWSRYEGFGLPPLEAMNCGTPAIVSDQGALPEVVGEGAHIVPLGDEAAFGQAILDLVSPGEQRDAMIERGYGHAAQFTWRRHADRVIEIYREVAGAL